ncbi:serine/threonine protein kinase [bacterium]|nr:serine/threonine protein kinase [bacterium]
MRIGEFETLGELGRGAAGVVLRARAPDGRAVAIKLLRRIGPDAYARFERETRMVASLGEREGFVPLLASGDSPHGPYFAMPLLEGGTLRDKLRRGALGVEESVALVLALARALAHAHARGIVHRDLKPENVLFLARDGRGKPLVADLGLAKHFSQDGASSGVSLSLSRTGELRGTAGYMAPEQMHDSKSVGPQADVFSLGALLYECLAGAPLFTGATAIEVMIRVQDSSFEPIDEKASVPRWLARTVERCLARDPKDRFRDAGELARALEARKGPSRTGATRTERSPTSRRRSSSSPGTRSSGPAAPSRGASGRTPRD